MRVLLSLDMSTTCTGWSTLDCDTGKLITYGTIKPGSKYNEISIGKLEYPKQQLFKMLSIGYQIRNIIEQHKPTHIVIEEVAGSKQRISQKTLDGLHYVVAYCIQEYLDIVKYYDVSGLDGWRTNLQLRLSDADKAANKEAKKLNPKLGKGVPKLPIYDWKDLAARFVNREHGLNLDPQLNQFDADLADSIAMGTAWVRFKCPKNV